MNDNEPGSKMELQLGRVKEINVGMVCATTKFVCVCGGVYRHTCLYACGCCDLFCILFSAPMIDEIHTETAIAW